jgi:hypothetical protein
METGREHGTQKLSDRLSWSFGRVGTVQRLGLKIHEHGHGHLLEEKVLNKWDVCGINLQLIQADNRVCEYLEVICMLEVAHPLPHSQISST